MSKEYNIPGYHSNPKDTLHKRGRDAPDVPLHEIQKQLLEYLRTIKAIKEAEKVIEKKYSIKKDIAGLWSIDDIKKAWGKTQRMNWPHEKNKRTHWSVVIILQMLLQRKEESEYDATESKLEQIFTGLNLYDSSSETQDYPEPSAVNIPIETRPSVGAKRKNTSQDNPKNKRIKVEKEAAFGIYIPLYKFKATNKLDLKKKCKKREEPNKRGTRLQLIDGKPKFGNCDNDQYLLGKTSHVVQYDNETNNAAWVFEILNEETIKGPAVQSTYRLDYSTHKDHRAPESLKNYSKTGFQKGHLAAAANHKWCQKARDDTNLLSNIAPQHKDLNQGKWKDLENLCRLYVQDEDYSKAYIYTGPLYLTEDITEDEKTSRRNFRSMHGKALPTHFFKVIILEKKNGERDLKCYKIPNEGEEEKQKTKNKNKNKKTIKEKIESIEKDLSKFSTIIGYIEEVSGLTFTEKNPEILEDREKVVTVNFREDYENIMITPTDEIETIVETVEIISRQNTVHRRKKSSYRKN